MKQSVVTSATTPIPFEGCVQVFRDIRTAKILVRIFPSDDDFYPMTKWPPNHILLADRTFQEPQWDFYDIDPETKLARGTRKCPSPVEAALLIAALNQEIQEQAEAQ